MSEKLDTAASDFLQLVEVQRGNEVERAAGWSHSGLKFRDEGLSFADVATVQPKGNGVHGAVCRVRHQPYRNADRIGAVGSDQNLKVCRCCDGSREWNPVLAGLIAVSGQDEVSDGQGDRSTGA